jgi:hypothetical protein
MAAQEVNCVQAAETLRAKCAASQRLDMHGTSIEPALLDVLNWLKGHPQCRKEFVEVLLSTISDQADRLDVPWELLPFCMRELRWPEIQAGLTRALDEAVQRNDWRAIPIFTSGLEAYEPEWSDAALFDYYRR